MRSGAGGISTTGFIPCEDADSWADGSIRADTSATIRSVPQVTLRTIVNGREEAISEYACDWPDCPHAGRYAFVLPSLSARAVVCAEHAVRIARRAGRDDPA
jgi:hypothetical protein